MHTDDLICMMAKSPPCCTHKRNIRIWMRVLMLLLAFIAIVAALVGLRDDFALMRYDAQMLFKYATISAVTLGTGLAWWYSGHPGRSWKISFYGLIFMAGLLLAVTLRAVYAEGASMMPYVFNEAAFLCVGFVSAFAVLGSAFLVRITGCMAPTNCRAHAIMTALFAASLGAFAFSMHCQQDHPGYLALWYGGTMLVYTLIAVPVLMKKQAW